MRRSGTGSGGGYGSKNVLHPNVRTGTGGKGTRPAGVAQIGVMVGDHITERRSSSKYKGEKLHGGGAMNPVKFGNEIALNIGKGGPGTGRTVHYCGSQSAPVDRPIGSTRDTLAEFGPDSAIVGSRRK